jgi:hypothetical protein
MRRAASAFLPCVAFGVIMLGEIDGLEATVADQRENRSTIEVQHVSIVSSKSFTETKAALEKLVPELDQGVMVLLRYGESDRARRELDKGPELARFLSRDHGGLLQIAGQRRKALQYEIGNPLTASRMTRHRLEAALYAPVRVLLYEDDAGRAILEYDSPASLFGQFGDKRVAAVARELDSALERVLLQASQ